MYRPIGYLIYFLVVLQYGACLDYDGWLNIDLRHTLCCKEEFCKRGVVALKSLRAGIAVFDQIEYTENHINELKKLAKNDGFYTMQTIVTSANNYGGNVFLSSVKAQSFLDSGLSDVITAWVLPNGEVIAVTFTATNTSQGFTPKGNGYKIHSSIYLRHIDQAPVPDTATYVQKLERERDAREKGDLKDNRSFLAKYWMYIVPIAIFVMISGASNPDAGGQAVRQ